VLPGTTNSWPFGQYGEARSPNRAESLAGTLVGQYEIISKVGGGGQGVVYLALDTRLGRRVALKFLRPEWCEDDLAVRRFVREAQAGSAAQHPSICTIHGLETTADDQFFIVMAYYEGQTLKQRLQEGALGVDVAVNAAAQIAEGLAAAHARGVVHRDVKPGNLLMSSEGIKILDFGVARLADSLQLTIDGFLLGTPAYMAPERLRGEEADARSDVWSVGVVLYEMVTGVTPFRGAHPDAVSFAIRNDPPPSLAERAVGVSAELENAVMRALRKDPRERFQSARDLAHALRRAKLSVEEAARNAWTTRAFKHLKQSRTRLISLIPACTSFFSRQSL
jgi:eukaryotic-like serine/threonine-protein kinase